MDTLRLAEATAEFRVVRLEDITTESLTALLSAMLTRVLWETSLLFSVVRLVDIVTLSLTALESAVAAADPALRASLRAMESPPPRAPGAPKISPALDICRQSPSAM